MNLHKEYSDFKIPEEINKINIFTGRPLFGSKGLTKIILFAQEKNINNDVIDYYMSIPPARQEGENDNDEYKSRTRFQKVLLKYRPYIYDFDNLKN